MNIAFSCITSHPRCFLPDRILSWKAGLNFDPESSQSPASRSWDEASVADIPLFSSISLDAAWKQIKVGPCVYQEHIFVLGADWWDSSTYLDSKQ